MYHFIEEMAYQREREIAARTRSGLFARQAELSHERRQARSERGHVRIPSPSMEGWRRWARRTEVRCTRAAAVTGAC